jgi:redox-sensitive bicupin YhaK (pirin superfamily)
VNQVKQLKETYAPGAAYTVGDGFPVRNMFPSNPIQAEMSPFLLLDYAGPHYFPPSVEPKGVDEHPHRGFETVTIVYQGAFEHRDSSGIHGSLEAGDIQWMTAGSGVVHEEKHSREFARRGGTIEAIQLWVNLPREFKMTPPQYQTLLRSEIPVVSLPGATVRVIAGTFDGRTGPAKTHTLIHLWDCHLGVGASLTLPLQSRFTTAVFYRHDPRLDLYERAGDRIELTAGDGPVDFVALHGEPIAEPIASGGPFVMNTRAELLQAFEDYQSGRMGRLERR